MIRMMILKIVRFHLELHFLFDKLKGLARCKDNNERTLMGVRQKLSKPHYIILVMSGAEPNLKIETRKQSCMSCSNT